MKILILNSIPYTPHNNSIPRVTSIKDCMIYNLALGFKSLGHDVTLVIASEYRPVNAERYELNVVFMPSAVKKIFMPTVLPFQPQLLNFLLKNKKQSDLIITSEIFAFPSLLAAIVAPSKTLVWHELAALNRKMKKIPALLWYNIVAKVFFKKIRVVARSVKARKFIASYVSNVSYNTIEHGVNLEKFRFSSFKKRQFVVVAQLIARKNIESIIEKFSRLVNNNEFGDFSLIIAGQGELEKKLKYDVDKFGLVNNVFFIGFQPHFTLNKIVAESMAMLIDTKQDNNLVSIPESIASGTPVVTNLVPTNAEIIRQNNLGLAKEWDENDLKIIIDNNHYYVQNCIEYRNQISTKACAQALINSFFD